jgi:hypothetical protein
MTALIVEFVLSVVIVGELPVRVRVFDPVMVVAAIRLMALTLMSSVSVTVLLALLNVAMLSVAVLP